jgi:hypothetical protein
MKKPVQTDTGESRAGLTFTGPETVVLVTNMTVFRGNWARHRRFLEKQSGEGGLSRREAKRIVESLRTRDARFQIQRSILVRELRGRLETMQVEQLLDLCEFCRNIVVGDI